MAMLVLVALISLGWSALVHAHPINDESGSYELGWRHEKNSQTWKRVLDKPCADHEDFRETLADNDHHKPSFHYGKIIKALDKTINTTLQLLHHYMQHRFGSARLMNEWEYFELSGLPKPLVRHHLQHLQVREIVNSSYTHLSKAYIYLDRLRKDETDYDESDDKTTHAVNSLLHKLLPRILCHLKTIMTSQNIQVERDVMDEIMQMEIQDIGDRALRHIRDFLILRDVKALLKGMRRDFILVQRQENDENDLSKVTINDPIIP